MLKKDVIRGGKNQVIGSVTTGYAGGSSIVRDEEGHLFGKTSETIPLDTRCRRQNRQHQHAGPRAPVRR